MHVKALSTGLCTWEIQEGFAVDYIISVIIIIIAVVVILSEPRA